MCSLSTISCVPEIGWSASSCITNASAGGQDEQPSAVNNSTSTGEGTDSDACTTLILSAPLPSAKASKISGRVRKTTYRGNHVLILSTTISVPSHRDAQAAHVSKRWSKSRKIPWYVQGPICDYLGVPQPDRRKRCDTDQGRLSIGGSSGLGFRNGRY